MRGFHATCRGPRGTVPFQDTFPVAARARRHSVATARRGMSMIEIMLVLAIVSVLIATAAPSFGRNMEQSRADIAGANLRAVWTAERVYWLEYRRYADSLGELESLDLIDRVIATASEPYTYQVRADADTFTVEAIRSGSSRWRGTLSIDETGSVTGSIEAEGEMPIEPGFLQ